MDTPTQFRMRANEYRRLAEVTADPEHRGFRFEMAEYFERAAKEAEQREAGQPA
jgi:hypothetical protein